MAGPADPGAAWDELAGMVKVKSRGRPRRLDEFDAADVVSKERG